MATSHGTDRITAIVVRASVIIALSLTLLVAVHSVFTGHISYARLFAGGMIAVYFFIAELVTRKQHYIFAGWMVMLVYTAITVSTLLLWGLNAPVGVLAIGFIVFLSGVMLGPKHIPWVISFVVVFLFGVQYIHASGYIRPDLHELGQPSHYFDVLTYVTILGAFALLSWLSGKQTEYLLLRARVAEKKVRLEKENLALKLEEQSRHLHAMQLQEMVAMYKFAEIGRSAVATLHELSNLLSVLTLDIDDIRHQHQRSEAITNAKEGIHHINQLVRHTRHQLQDNVTSEVFNAIPTIERTIKEMQIKFVSKNVELHKVLPQRTSFRILGDPQNLSHVIIILLNNALDAVLMAKNPKVTIEVIQNKTSLIIDVVDTGHGIPEQQQALLFHPHKSSKPSGLGVGLFITRHIVESQLGGKIKYIHSDSGARFQINIPRYIKEAHNEAAI